jgi:CBS domain containing-hemolysin-like protein
MLHRMQRIPKGGDLILEGKYRLTIVDMEGKRIARVKIERLDGPIAVSPQEPPRA